jgi:hypothetical protein
VKPAVISMSKLSDSDTMPPRTTNDQSKFSTLLPE